MPKIVAMYLDNGEEELSKQFITVYFNLSKAKEAFLEHLLLAWSIGLVMMLGGGFFGYRTLKDVIEHGRRYEEEKADKETLRFWYLDWIFILLDAILGTLARPAVVTSLIFFLIGTVTFVLYTIRIIAKLFGFDLVF
ncbi:hypothetical protein [Paenibacillus sp. yr247]|uniref:hypothetical protein n=1 Tax=Paenibacillus sp. yr247 TaxID=1761880 RepID=UPI000B89235F|nr:hypothetical protein [Paenibacillus sp. yr247]